MAKQALDLLMAKLGAAGKFILLERSDADKVAAEVKAGSSQRIPADYLILGSITASGGRPRARKGSSPQRSARLSRLASAYAS